MSARAVRIDTIRHVHCTVLRASGELDHAGRARLSARIQEVWDWSDGPILVFDLADVVFYDSSLVGALAVALQRVRATRSGRIILANPPERLVTVLERTGLLRYVEIRGDVQETVAEIVLAAERSRREGAGGVPMGGRAGAGGVPEARSGVPEARSGDDGASVEGRAGSGSASQAGSGGASVDGGLDARSSQTVLPYLPYPR
ncbi:STAS domain-containing protein [Nonomuraea sp. NEAU-A123]|uniref:STAS domain-containing protein n=1 Tax=Nonomuraea sp. NEAU-A123 TaxID=2839649 RepID=UPI001BE40DEF|nr:STAS domain-containing protein [Nonomuraea sp. NEAU-A123]MBT2226125.1 STAS domain-containing protein [Nonomuraea sp. NEAU-A123]